MGSLFPTSLYRNECACPRSQKPSSYRIDKGRLHSLLLFSAFRSPPFPYPPFLLLLLFREVADSRVFFTDNLSPQRVNVAAIARVLFALTLSLACRRSRVMAFSFRVRRSLARFWHKDRRKPAQDGQTPGGDTRQDNENKP